MRKFSKYSDELILESVLKIINNERSMADTSRLLGAGFTQVRRWVAMYKQHGETGLFKRNGSYSADFKLHVLADRRENNLSLIQTITKYAIPSESTLLKWERTYARDGVEGIYASCNEHKTKDMKSSKTKKTAKNSDDALVRELEYLRAENAYLKKLRALVLERIARESRSAQKPSRN